MSESVEDIETRGMSRNEAEEVVEATVAFPRTPQILYSLEREDGIVRQHYNLI